MTDRAAWQVEADALQARGDPRGTVMALQLALEAKPEDPQLRAAEREALAPLLTGKLADALPRFEKLAAELAADPEVIRLAWFTHPPVTERELHEVETALGAPLHESIRTFFRQTNGLQLMAQRRDGENFDAEKHRPVSSVDKVYGLTEDYYLTHAVCIPTLSEIFLEDFAERLWFDWMTDDEQTTFGGVEYPLLSFSKSLRLVDVGNGFYPVGFALLTDRSNPKLGLGDDYGAGWDAPSTLTFEEYLSNVLQDRAVQRLSLARFRSRE